MTAREAFREQGIAPDLVRSGNSSVFRHSRSMKIMLLALLLTQVDQQVNIAFSNGQHFVGRLERVYSTGLLCERSDGSTTFIPYSELPGYWRSQCLNSNHHSREELSGSMENL
jgi:hypothetical protein